MISTILDNVTYHAVYDASVLDALALARVHGFRGIQVAAELPHLAVGHMTDGELDDIAAYCAEHDLSVSLHAPDDTASLCLVDPELTRGVISYYGALFNAAERIGAHAVTVHLGAIPRFRTDSEPQQAMPIAAEAGFRKCLSENLMRLAGLAAGRCAVCIENHGLDEIACELMEPLIAKGFLHLCWDAAKAHGKPTDSPMARLFNDYAYRIRVVHLHDVRDGRSHAVLDTGEVDIRAAVDWLAPLDVREWCIEVRPVEKAVESFAALRALA